MAQNKLLKNESDKQNVPKHSTETRLEQQKFDLKSIRIQMLIGTLLSAAVCVVFYWPTLHTGFLLDDFLHVDIAARAFQGDARDLLSNFVSNWAGSDLMKSYRPIVSMSFAVDYFLWHANALGYHVTNLLLLIACCVLTSLTALELTGRRGNRVMAAPAIWAGLLFAAYPLHPEAAAWIIGRVDLICTAFYLASVFYFLRFQQNKETRYLRWSLVAFIFSMISKEMAVTLPFVLTAASIILPADELEKEKGDISDIEKLVEGIKSTWPFWASLAVIACLRTYFLGTVIGGYGNSLDLHSLYSAALAFLDRSSIAKIFVPISEEMHVQNYMIRACTILIPLIMLLGGIKATIFKSSFKPIAFLLFWLGIAILPTFQIWHIYPNLLGSRLFFLSSAPFCILLSLLAVPAVESIKRKTTFFLSATGTILLAVTFLLWGFCLQKNLVPWIEAGRRMTAIKKQLNDLSSNAKGTPISLLTLPRDYKGAGMLTRPYYLSLFCKPPFNATDINHNFKSLEMRGGVDPDYGIKIGALARNRDCYIWSESEGLFVPWQHATGSGYFQLKFNSADAFDLVPPDVITRSSTGWQISRLDAAYIERHPDFIRIYPGMAIQYLTVKPKPLPKIDPLEAQFAIVRCIIHDRDDQDPGAGPYRANKISLWWTATDDKQKQNIEAEKSLEYLADDLFIAPVGESADWSLASRISDFGLKFSPGNYVVDLYSVTLGSKPSSRKLDLSENKMLERPLEVTP